ncbi:MAG: PDZ domain-containing protein, partial [Alphaproteobacteria bacterium]|nr:PDZ domain-containing protein [Alphaproteobacteria bacterium]
ILRNGSLRKFTLKLVAAPERPARNLTKLTGRQPLAYATVANLSPALAEELGQDTLGRGVIVMQVDGQTPARRYLRPGDKILQINRDRIELVKDLVRSLKKPVDKWQITMQRGKKVRTIRFGL